MTDIIGPEIRDPNVSRENLDRMLEMQKFAQASLQELLQKLGTNEYKFDVGQYNQLLRSICVHYPTLDDFILASVKAWIDMNRKKVEGK